MATTTKEFTIADASSRSSEIESEVPGETMAINVGPSHPTTHGVLRLMMELDGDIIKKCEPVLGYLHRGDEKIAENMTYNQFVAQISNISGCNIRSFAGGKCGIGFIFNVTAKI
ncbi:MAG: hypothetical protein R6U56_05435 [Opitutales bacterium]